MRFTATRAKTFVTSFLIVTAGLGLAAYSGSNSSDSTTPATKQIAGKTSDGGVAAPSTNSEMTGGAVGGSAQPIAPQGQQPGGDNQQGGQQLGQQDGANNSAGTQQGGQQPGGGNQQGDQQGQQPGGDNQQGGQQQGGSLQSDNQQGGQQSGQQQGGQQPGQQGNADSSAGTQQGGQQGDGN